MRLRVLLVHEVGKKPYAITVSVDYGDDAMGEELWDQEIDRVKASYRPGTEFRKAFVTVPDDLILKLFVPTQFVARPLEVQA